MAKSEWAGWMQAIGTVVAIWAAIRIAASGREEAAQNADKLKYAARDRTIRAVARILEQFAQIADRVYEVGQGDARDFAHYKTGNGTSRTLGQDSFETDVFVAALDSVDWHSFGSVKLTEQFLSARYAMKVIRQYMTALEKAVNVEDTHAEFVFGGLADAVFSARAARSEFTHNIAAW